MLIYMNRILKSAKPMNSALFLLAIPVLSAMVAYKNPGFLSLSVDAAVGASLAAVVYLYSLLRLENPTRALLHASMMLVLYGLARYYIFNTYLLASYDQSLRQMESLLPQLASSAEMKKSMSLAGTLLQASWTVPQLLALLAGHFVLQHMRGTRSQLRDFHLPRYYNLLILVLIPLYLVPSLREVFVNLLMALCVLPLVQGMGVIVHYIARINSNLLVIMLITALVIFNLILVVLLGFADIWLDLRKLNKKGMYA
jgi:hypothetical protein